MQDSTDQITEAIRENLSPAAVAAIYAYLQPARTDDGQINREIEWFKETLVQTIGGYKAMNAAMDEAGV